MTNESAATAERLSQPHFDDEATRLSAQPVIPLAAVRAERVGKRWVPFAAVIAVSVLLGAVSGTLIYSERSQTPAQNEEKIAQRESEIALASQTPPAGTEDVPARATVDAGAVSHEVKELNEGHKKGQDKSLAGQIATANSKNGSSREKSKVRLRSSLRSTGMAEDVGDNGSLRDKDEREWRREERREETRQRRATRQASPNRDRLSDDLFRIREIFEGSPRP